MFCFFSYLFDFFIFIRELLQLRILKFHEFSGVRKYSVFGLVLLSIDQLVIFLTQLEDVTESPVFFHFERGSVLQTKLSVVVMLLDLFVELFLEFG